MKSLILGGTRSGKSRLAESLAMKTELPVTYIATATALDDEMQNRIALHQQNRPGDWQTLEEPTALAQTLKHHAANDRCIIVDCLTLWLTNLLCNNQQQLDQEKSHLIELVPHLPGTIIFVSNEVGLGVMPTSQLARQYCDEIGIIHQTLAEQCEQVILCVAGLPHILKGAPL